MSASLVGSEMCIRDRGDAASRGRPGALARGRAPGGGASLRATPPRRECCLLYTSDAADDM
eukprot:6843422-Alexandrium_andersonii.AAC.1